jgi:hypothetical protein
VIEQMARRTRILGRDQRRRAQDVQRAQRYVLHVADRRRDEVQRAH